MPAASYTIPIKMHGKELVGNILSVGVSAGMVFGAYTLYSWALPQPVVVLRHRIFKNTTIVDVTIEKGTWGNLVNLTQKHNNVACLCAAGFSVYSFSTNGPAVGSVLQLQHEGRFTRDEFLDLCSKCQVSTDVECDDYPLEQVKWDNRAVRLA